MKHFVLMLAAVAVLGIQSTFAQNRVKNLSTEQTRLDVAQVENTEQTVRLSRYLYAGYNTLCLPMSLSAEQLQQAVPGARIERLVGIGQEGSTLNLYFADCTAEGIDAGMPYLIFSPTKMYMRVNNTDATQFSHSANVVRMTDGQGNQVSFSSSWELRQRDGMYGIPAKQSVEVLESVLMRTTAEQGFYPTRCGFNWEHQSASALQIEIKHIGSMEGTTGLNVVERSQLNSQRCYTLDGREVEHPTSGVYIVGGKKVVVK